MSKTEKRIEVSLPEALVKKIDVLVDQKCFTSREEALKQFIEAGLFHCEEGRKLDKQLEGLSKEEIEKKTFTTHLYKPH